jgi:hypothetical protein
MIVVAFVAMIVVAFVGVIVVAFVGVIVVAFVGVIVVAFVAVVVIVVVATATVPACAGILTQWKDPRGLRMMVRAVTWTAKRNAPHSTQAQPSSI